MRRKSDAYAMLACLALPLHAAADDASPFPPGKSAALVKKVCTECHAPSVVISTRFDDALAKKMYKRFVGDPESEQGKQVVEYLTTMLGEN